MSPSRALFASFLCSLFAMAVGCTNNLKREDVLSLRLDSTTPADVHQRFGTPTSTSSQSVGSQTFAQEVYTDKTAAFGGYDLSFLSVEFKNGRLNGYNYVSSVKDDKTYAYLQENDAIVIGKTTRDEVERLLGEPAGRVHVPSAFRDIDDFTSKDPNAVEIWQWSECNGLRNYSYYAPEVRFRTLYVVFDRAGKVIRKGSSDRSLGHYWPNYRY